MAQITTLITREETNIKRIERRVKKKVNIRVVNRIYKQESLETLLANETLMDKIVKNGYYKAAVCDRFDIDVLTIIYKETEHKFIALQSGIDIRKLIKGQLKTKPIDVHYIDEDEEYG